MAKKNTTIYVTAFILFLGALSYLCYSGFSENSVYFLNVSEANALPKDQLGQARLFGLVTEDGLEKSSQSVKFQLADKDDPSQLIEVAYRGVIPDTFKAGAEVIVEGALNDEGCFFARTLMTKCPSKYQKENRTKNSSAI